MEERNNDNCLINCPWNKNEKFVLEALKDIKESITSTREETKRDIQGLTTKVEGLEGFKNRIAGFGALIAFLTASAVSIVAALLGKSSS